MPEGGGDRCSNLPTSSWTSDSSQLSQQSSLSGALPSFIPNGRTTTSDTHWESSLFSSSLSELFSRKCKLLISVLQIVLVLILGFLITITMQSVMG